ncbi:hypothetical protein TEA_020362 [Camellia sinensis var. sinensis]|uniref:Uncharacterized protein n=1 Tax=Camellia sinensis var. sinensis TaxID=542762 RepID=A0A4V3WRA4_CAMSN|nr:hypothetical protein TEA_020362 [Camellia sinensis var. sinensis]
MLQYPAFMTQYPWSTTMIPTSFLLPAQWPQPQNDELLLAKEESDFEDKVFFFWAFYGCDIAVERFRVLRVIAIYTYILVERIEASNVTLWTLEFASIALCNEIRMTNSNLIVIGRTTVDIDKEDYDNGADDDEADNAEESEGDEFEQETG